MWEAICKPNQWTMHIEHLLQRLTVNPRTDPSTVGPISYADSFPYQTCDIQIPHGRTGYVYMLLSIRDTNRTYIGQGASLSDRLDKHNKGIVDLGALCHTLEAWHTWIGLKERLWKETGKAT